MTKKTKITSIIGSSVLLFVWWALMAITNTKFKMVNYWWQAALAVAVVMFGIFGLMAAKHWSWLKSGVGRGVFFISLGLITWGLGQAGWTYFVIKDPAQQSPPTHLLDILYFSTIPLWTVGMFYLSKATGARYGLRSLWAKVGVLALILVMFAISYYLLVTVARGGNAYFHSDTVLNIIFDLGYAAGDVVNLTLALAIFGLSWKYLGGRFKKPILLILFGFAMSYLGDLVFSFYDGRDQYYNGHWVDLLYLAMAAIFAAGLCLLDPTLFRKFVPTPTNTAPQPQIPVTPVATPPETPGLQATVPPSTPNEGAA